MSREQTPPDSEALIALNRAATTARLLAGAVHEVNNALQVISGSVELLEQQPALSAATTKSLDRIKRQTERAAEALSELQGFTKASLEGQERFDLRACVTAAISLRRYAAARAGLTIETPPGQTEAMLARGNAGLFQQALLNVLINAEQAMAGTIGRITVHIHGDPVRVGVTVSDTGPGIDEASPARRFEPFASTRTPQDGAGLGLWAAHAILEAAGGSLQILSPSAPGASIVLWLPRT